jgi:hypothetical protein
MVPAKIILVATVFFLWFWASLLTGFKSFLPFGSFFSTQAVKQIW